MLIEEAGWTYFYSEKEFVKYFDRLQAIGMSYDEIENKLPQLEHYYYEMVIKNIFYVNIPTINNLFNKWKKFHQ